MKSKKSLLFKIGALVLVLAVAALMFVIGRGHTVYFDNKTLEYEGTEYKCPYKVVVSVNGEQVAKLYKKERGMATWIGQDFQMTLEITQEKGGEETVGVYNVKLPYNMDGVVINLPGYLAGLPTEAYLSEFVSLIAEQPAEDEEVVIDEFAIPVETTEATETTETPAG